MKKVTAKGLTSFRLGAIMITLYCNIYDAHPCLFGGWEGYWMAEIRLKENESLDSALRRFKKQCARAGVIQEVRKREAYEKPSVKRKKKSEAARKRKYK